MNAFLTATLLLPPGPGPEAPHMGRGRASSEGARLRAHEEDRRQGPVVFDFHGHGGTARNAARAHHLHKEWPEAVVVYPQGLKTAGRMADPEGKLPGWQKKSGDQEDRDLKFFDAVLASLKKDYKVDEKRIYATGHSNGGSFTYLIWAKRGETFAAFAPVAAAGGPLFREAKPRPLFHAASEKDLIVGVRHPADRRWIGQAARRLRRPGGGVGRRVPAATPRRGEAGRGLSPRRGQRYPGGRPGR